MNTTFRRDKGFTLMEMLVATAGGLIILAASMSIFTSAMKSAVLATDRADLQQNVRSALNAITHDLTMAGAQIQSGVPVPSNAKYKCDQSSCGLITFPVGPSGNPTLFGIIPDPAALTHPTEQSITIVYPDASLAQCPIADSTPSGSQVTLGACMTTSVPESYFAYNDPGYGLKEGDIMLFSSGADYRIGVVTNLPANAADKGKVNFANNDKLNINQPSASHGNLAGLLKTAKAASLPVNARRLMLITYSLQKMDGPDGVSGTSDDFFRLMRQVNAGTPVPLAENIATLQFSYDVYDDSTATMTSNSTTANGRPDLIRKVNIMIEAKGVARKAVSKTQYLRLATSVEPRNLVYKNIYQIN